MSKRPNDGAADAQPGSSALALAILGALVIALGAGMVYLPAGVVVAGLELLAAAYVVRYLEAQRATP
jgi:hypothetical protein